MPESCLSVSVDKVLDDVCWMDPVLLAIAMVSLEVLRVFYLKGCGKLRAVCLGLLSLAT